MVQNQDQQRNLNRTHNNRNLQYTPPSRHERPTKDTAIILSNSWNGAVKESRFLVPIGEVVVGLPGAKEGYDEQEAA